MPAGVSDEERMADLIREGSRRRRGKSGDVSE